MFLEYKVAVILWLNVLVHVILSPMINVLCVYIRTLRSMCEVSSMAAFVCRAFQTYYCYYYYFLINYLSNFYLLVCFNKLELN